MNGRGPATASSSLSVTEGLKKWQRERRGVCAAQLAYVMAMCGPYVLYHEKQQASTPSFTRPLLVCAHQVSVPHASASNSINFFSSELLLLLLLLRSPSHASRTARQ